MSDLRSSLGHPMKRGRDVTFLPLPSNRNLLQAEKGFKTMEGVQDWASEKFRGEGRSTFSSSLVFDEAGTDFSEFPVGNLNTFSGFVYNRARVSLLSFGTELSGLFPLFQLVINEYAYYELEIGVGIEGEFSVESGALPLGISLSSVGVVSGTPILEQVTQAVISIAFKGHVYDLELSFAVISVPVVEGLSLWLDASDETTLYDATTGGSLVAPDGQVARWEDKSGNGLHAVQATLNNRPTRKVEAQNLRDAVGFNGSTNFLSEASGIYGPQTTIYAVARLTLSNGSYQRIVHLSDTLNVRGFFGTWLGDFSTFFGNGSTWNDASANTPLESMVSTWNAVGVVNNNVSATPFFNGAPQDPKNGATISATGLKIGASHTASTLWDGDIAEVIIYNRALSPTERRQVEEYLQAKWATPALPE